MTENPQRFFMVFSPIWLNRTFDRSTASVLPSRFTRLVLQRLFRRPAEIHARDKRVYTALIDHLYADVASIIGGVIGIMALAWFCHIADPENGFFSLMIVMGLVGAVRAAFVLRYNRRHKGPQKSYRKARIWELYYTAGALTFAALLGAFAIMVFADPQTENLRTITIAAVVGYAGGIAGRNAGRPVVALGQVAASCVPLTIYMLVNPTGTNFGLAILLLIYMATLGKIVRALNAIVSRAFKTERDVGEVNNRLDNAITHMMSGLCMIDTEGKISILNQRFRLLLDLPDMRFERLHEILLTALSRGTLHHAEIGQIQACLRGQGDLVLKFMTDKGQVLLMKVGIAPSGDQILTIDDVTEQTRAAADVERMAKFDTLTGLANRATILAALGMPGVDATTPNARPQHGPGLLLLDLDKFKQINDSLGHDAGDRLLVKVAERLRALAPKDACVGRLGGDEFVVVLPGASRKECLALAGRMVKAIAKPIRVGGHVCHTTVSIGVACGPEHGENASELMKAADIALYAQKGKGRNGFDLFDAEMAQQLAKRRQLEHDLAQALKEDGVYLAFQPIVAADDRRVLAFEALARWNHPEFGQIPPDVFIPIAESTGMIDELGRHVLMTACREAMNWPDHIKVSVNVSPLQFKNQDALFTDIWLALSASGLPARRLDLEVTESVLIDDAEGMLQLIESFRAMDISVSLDDFGTGYSSLAYVQNYRFDKIKLDKAFARSIETDRTSRATIAALANIAQATGSKLLLEGVETEAQARIAAAHGVGEMQGYLFSRPIPASEILSKILGKFNEKRVA
jgi:diguanylate cyclase (GGDEF)-like protein